MGRRTHKVHPEHQAQSPGIPAGTGLQPDGIVLADLVRGDGEFLVLTLETYLGNPFVRAQAWQRNPDGTRRPLPGKSVSIRVREIDSMIKGLIEADERLAANEPIPPPKSRERRVTVLSGSRSDPNPTKAWVRTGPPEPGPFKPHGPYRAGIAPWEPQ